jgi:ATP-dependent Lon protease
MTTTKKIFSFAVDAESNPHKLDEHHIPDELPILPLRNTVAFPFTIIPLSIGISRSIKLIEDAQQADHLIGLVAMKDPQIEEPLPGQVYEVGSIARIERVA